MSSKTPQSHQARPLLSLILMGIITVCTVAGFVYAGPSGFQLATRFGKDFASFFNSGSTIGVEADYLHLRVNDTYLSHPSDGSNQIVGTTVFSGNVGVQKAPTYNLDVLGDINFTGTLYRNGVPFSVGASQWTTSGTTIYYTGGYVAINKTNPTTNLDVSGSIVANAFYFSTGGSFFGGGGTGSTYLWTTNGNHIYSTNTGNVGIGTGNPSFKLDLYEVANNGMKIQAGDAVSDVALSVGSASTPDKFIIQAGGNVGIGTLSPTVKLEVSGNIIASDPTISSHVATKAYVDAAVGAAGGAGSKSVVFTGGAGTWTVPTGVTGIRIILVGGGGGGGSHRICECGGGGTCGASTNGSAGGTTTFGSYSAAGGGGGGIATTYNLVSCAFSYGAGGNGGGVLGGAGGGCYYSAGYQCSYINATDGIGGTSRVRYGGGGGTCLTCQGGRMSPYSGNGQNGPTTKGGGSFSAQYGAGGSCVAGGYCPGGGGAEVVDMDIPVTPGENISYSVATGGAGGVITAPYPPGGMTQYAGTAGMGGYIQINYVN